MQFCEIGVLAPLADNDDAGFILDLMDRFEQVAIAQLRPDAGQTLPLEPGFCGLDDQPSAFSGQPCALFIMFCEFFQELGPRAQREIAGQIDRAGSAGAMINHMQKIYAEAGLSGDPGGVVARAFTIGRAVNQGDDTIHGLAPNARWRDQSHPACRVHRGDPRGFHWPGSCPPDGPSCLRGGISGR